MLFKQKGSSFIEVLVALVILAIGLLGVLSMHSRGLASNQRALFASEVNLLVSDMTDRIRAYTVTGANAQAYDALSTNGVALGDPVAEADRIAWGAAILNSSLPSALGDVTWNPVQQVYVISLRWDDARQGIAAQAVAIDCGSADLIADQGNSLSCYQFTVNL